MIAALRMSPVLGALAKLLAASSVYGLVPCGVSRRVRAIGIHMALGANKSNVTIPTLPQTMQPKAIGALVALACCVSAAGVLSMNLSAATSVRLLGEGGPLNPASLLVVPGFLLSAAFLASYILVCRAGHMHAMLALRCEEV